MSATTRLAPAAPQPQLRRELGLFDAVSLVVGTIIGSSIFLIPNVVAAQMHTLWSVLLVWGVGGALTVCGALSLAELGSMYPASGGLCTYLQHAYGRPVAFLYAWALLFMIHSGSIAAVSIGFGIYAGQVFSLGVMGQKAVAAGVILVLSAINWLGIRSGKLVQNLVVVAKLAGLGGMILLLFWKGTRPLHLLAAAPAGSGGAFTAAGFGVALVAVLWAYEGWHVISFAAGEMKQPRRTLPRSLFIGSVLVMLIYMVGNLSYYHELLPSEIQGSSAVAALAVGRLLGPLAAKLLAILILVSLVGCLNGLVLTGGRVYYAMAQEGLFPHRFGRLNPRFSTPAVALWVQGIWAAALAASGSYQQMFSDVIFTAWIFYGLAAGAVVVLRRRDPGRERPFRVPGYPWLSLAFCAAAAGLAIATIVARPGGAALGLGLIATGVPVYYLLINRPSRLPPGAPIQ